MNLKMYILCRISILHINLYEISNVVESLFNKIVTFFELNPDPWRCPLSDKLKSMCKFCVNVCHEFGLSLPVFVAHPAQRL